MREGIAFCHQLKCMNFFLFIYFIKIQLDSGLGSRQVNQKNHLKLKVVKFGGFLTHIHLLPTRPCKTIPYIDRCSLLITWHSILQQMMKKI